MDYFKMTDSVLIGLYIDGDNRAFDVLVLRHQQKIFTPILIFVRDQDEANEIFQLTFFKIIETINAGKYNDEGKFLPWAIRIAHNICVDRFRKNKRYPHQSGDDNPLVYEKEGYYEESREEKMFKEQSYEKINKLVALLPTDQREVIMLRHYADYSFKEIAEMTNVSINTALGRMRYAVINLRKMIADYGIML